MPTDATQHTPRTDSFGRPLPAEAVSIADEMPRPNQSVILYIEDANVAIHGLPVVGWNSNTNAHPIWWAGVPGNYLALAHHRWTVTHWAPLPCAAAIAQADKGNTP